MISENYFLVSLRNLLFFNWKVTTLVVLLNTFIEPARHNQVIRMETDDDNTVERIEWFMDKIGICNYLGYYSNSESSARVVKFLLHYFCLIDHDLC